MRQESIKLIMSLNGDDIEKYHLTSLQGNLATLMKPIGYKNLVSNENSSIDGSLILCSPSMRKAQKRDLSLKFLIKSASLLDLQRDTDTLVNVLISGKNGSGLNELHVPQLCKTFRLVFSTIDSYSNYGLDGWATLSIKFTEPDPTNTAE